MPSSSINGAVISYEEQGQGTPLVLLHGFPLDGRIFENQAAALASRFRVIVPDLPGFGRSKSSSPFTIASLADDVHALLQSISALPCTLAGLSMGGYVSLAYAKKYPMDLTALILIDTRAEGDSAEGKAGRQKMIELVHASGSKAVADQMFPKMLTEQTAENRQGISGELRAIMENCPPETIENALMAMRDREDYTSILSSIAVPTLIIVGDRDPITPPPMSQAMHSAIPRSKLVQIPEASHISTMEKPAEVSKAILSFMGGLTTR